MATYECAWKATLDDLDKVRAPVLMYRSREDHVVDDLSALLLKERAVNSAVREVMLENSYHVATLDNDADAIFDGSLAFVREQARSGEGTKR